MTRIAKVVDNKDENKQGRVKCEILPELQGIETDHLPWVTPIQDYNGSKNYSQHVPSKDSYILVEVNDTWTEFYYNGDKPYRKNEESSSNAFDFLDNVKGLSSEKDGAQPASMIYKHDPEYLEYYDTETGEFGKVLSNKRYIIWTGKKDKKLIFGYDSNKYITIDEKGGLIIKANGANTPNLKIDSSDGTVTINGHLKVTT